MRRLVLGLFVLALIGAGATVMLINRYIDRRIQTTSTKVQKTTETMVVLVAKDKLPIGTKIEKSSVKWVQWPKDGVQDQFISASRPDSRKAAKVIGATTRRGILKGTPITVSAVFRNSNPGFLAGVLDPNMRAVSISVSPATGAAGFILPGDRVDVILLQDALRNSGAKSSDAKEGFKPYIRHTAETVLQNIRVLAVDQQVDNFEKKAKVVKTVTLEVTLKQAESLAVANAMGKLSLALRSFRADRLAADSDSETGSEPVSDQRKPAKMAGSAGVMSGRGGAMTAPANPEQENATVTTDIEISPILAASVRPAAGLEKPKMAMPAPAPVLPPPTAKKSAEPDAPRPQIRIYRSGRPSTVTF